MLKSFDDMEVSISASSGEREDQIFRNVVHSSISGDRHGNPIFSSENPVSHVVHSGVTSGSCGGSSTSFNDSSSSSSNFGNIGFFVPLSVNLVEGRLSVNCSSVEIRVHR